ncbi:uroporphyrinogen-III C-methyltransferase [Domibacillus epiphyticus]|uniref:Uroporphyrinogen-III C-methyltransferase n=1 Tax=Domibacillus epiphyticus TaxID=1714355 RepID=A0A1V2AB51_9BACI|nr:uroporphyrinogen-III C-methyltransferase [Domibacillus epiphyticus]OMP68219.1 uroporphyrinogen-III C-methyltransferase [Domibacillus epiphyticus]
MGEVYIVGAGPGDPDLITVKALKAIQKADVILYDRLVNKQLLKVSKPSSLRIFCGEFPQSHTMKQDRINQLMVKYASNGKMVVRLKGGDPFVFGRGGEEASYLTKHDILFHIIPGVTAGIAAPAYAGIPVTHREFGNSFAIVTGHQISGKKDVKWTHIATAVDTIIIYMGMKQLPVICDELMKNGRSGETMAAIIENGTTINQKVVTAPLCHLVEEVKKHSIANPAIIVIGDVVTCRETLDQKTAAVF